MRKFKPLKKKKKKPPILKEIPKNIGRIEAQTT